MVLIALGLLVASPAHAQSEDDPKSSIQEWPPRKPPPPPAPPPKPTPPPSGNAPANPPADRNPGDIAPDANAPKSPADANAQPGDAPRTPDGKEVKPLPPPKPSLPPGAQQPNMTGPTVQPDTNTGSIRAIDVPAGKTFDQVALPPGTISDGKDGLGQLVADVKVVDNTRTDNETVQYIAGVKVGMTLTPELVQIMSERLNTVGLFKNVEIHWVVLPTGGVRVVISAHDKLSWIVAPLFSYSTGNYGGGLAYANSNVFGKNKKFLVLGEYTTQQKLLFVAFLDPQIRNTRFYYRVDGLVRRDSIWEYSPEHIANPRIERSTDLDTFGVGALAGVNFTRRFKMDLRLKVYYDNVQKSSCYNTSNVDGSGTPNVVAEQGSCLAPSSSGWDNTFTLAATYDGRSNVYGVLHGLLVNAVYQYGASWLGTRYDYHLLSLYGMYAWRFFREHNLLLKIGSDVFFDAPFKLEVETGGPLMRGLVNRQYRGDTDVRATLEYYLPLFTLHGLSVRLVGFYDTNLTWFRSLPDQSSPLARLVDRGNGGFRDYLPDTPSGIVRESWHNGIGGGIRLYLRGVILPLLGADFAYGIDGNDFQWYISIGSTLD
ncbi:MAG TPA: BamA/TamA family outer membrane protein [Polyangia bacterium]|nr:BamA/TamA family outer membrane protein [Polyangia bacterium]